MVSLSVGCQDIKQNQKENSGQKQRFGQMNQRFKSELNLNETQEKQWDEIHSKYRNEFKNLRSEAAEARNEKMEKAKEIADELDKEVLSILDDDQKETYKELAEENRKKAIAKYNSRNSKKTGKSSFIQMKTELNLSEKQTQQWDAIQEDYKPKFKEIRDSGQPGSAETKKEIIALFEKKNAEILAILDSEQKVKYSQFVEERKQMAKQRRRNQ